MPARFLRRIFAATLLVILCHSSQAYAQGDLAKDLLKELIESQLRRGNRRTPSVRPPNLTPPVNQPRPGVRPPQPRTGAETAEIQQLRPIISSIARETDVLAQALTRDAPSSTGIRRLLPDAYQLQANATALDRSLRQIRDHNLALDQFRNLAANWETLKYDLSQRNELSRASKASIQRLNALEAQCLGILKIDEQFNGGEIVSRINAISAHLRDLHDDFRYLQLDRNERRRIDSLMHQHKNEVSHFGRLAGNTNFQICVNEYKQLYTNWCALRDSLSSQSDRHVTRLTQRIQNSHRDLHRMLRIELGFDKRVVTNYVHEIDEDLHKLFRSITLQDLLEIPNHAEMTQAAAIVSAELADLDKLAHAGGQTGRMADGWIRASEAWNVFAHYLEGSNNGRVTQAALQVAQGLEALRTTLGISIAVDPRSLARSAADLTQEIEHMQRVVARWHRRPGNHNRAIDQHLTSLQNDCKRFENTIRTRPDNVRYQQTQLDQVIRSWQVVRPDLAACNTSERDSLDEISTTITKGLIRLRTALAN